MVYLRNKFNIYLKVMFRAVTAYDISSLLRVIWVSMKRISKIDIQNDFFFNF